MKEKIIQLLTHEEDEFIKQGIMFNNSLEPKLLSDKEVMDLIMKGNMKYGRYTWRKDSLHWFLLEEFKGIGFEFIQKFIFHGSEDLKDEYELIQYLNPRCLSLTHYAVEEIPEWIKNMSKLTHLYITNNNKLRQLPEWFFELKLIELRLPLCPIKYDEQFIQNITKMKTLKELELDMFQAEQLDKEQLQSLLPQCNIIYT